MTTPDVSHRFEPDRWNCTITAQPTDTGKLPGEAIKAKDAAEYGSVMKQFMKDTGIKK